ncbi:M66 family metalloprotease [Acinetobacter chinensis]|uniref:M66 family metalloprotease n=1 Tax=Acinetobacter chinensis TaxID=2004650 RepID=A0ABU3WF45_9GAMM|nr:M66 family metalloprotease [Acinetobacter chinensis]MDV2469041.1 M66 family metalloprotease [Acinetobacter chinensis]
MQLQYKYLTICTLSAMLMACGGGGGSQSASEDGVVQKYAEPEKDSIESSTLGFYDLNAEGQNREIRNDLSGNFEAMLQFAQGHVVDPKGNEDKNMPRLTSEREALLLVTPVQGMGDIRRLNAEIYLDGRLLRTVELNDPAQLPLSDQANTDDRPKVLYSKRAWSAVLKWDEVVPGLSIQIVQPDSGKRGEITAESIDFAAPGELVLQNIRLGLLTDPPKSSGHYMLLEPEKAGTDYFQTIPAAQMIVTKYDDMKLDRVMIASGTIYDSVSASNGGYYEGDMRENIAKSTFSVGTNLANWGVTSSSMASQEQPQLTQSVVVHHARGKYANGEANHGLSGGNGMLTIIDSVGNEFSHEIGHHYGLGHYPGSVGDNMFWAAHHADSGWGYIAYRKKMRGNLDWGNKNLGDGSNGIPNFQNLYPYGKDAMSGGYSSSSISRYTHYTGYSTRWKIQPHFNARHVWDEKSPTGYKKWNETTRKMEVVQPKVPKSSGVWYNSADGNYLKPAMFGVPVYTILGGYDVGNQSGIIYPAARGNWGNVFNLPAPVLSADTANCWLSVQFANGVKNIALAPAQLAANSKANKFHINLAQSDQPQHVELFCQKAGADAVKLSQIDIPVLAALPAYVKIGREAGYSALRKIELPLLEQALLENANKSVIHLGVDARLWMDSYSAYKSELSAAAQAVFDRYVQQTSTMHRLNRWVDAYRADLTSGVPEAKAAFKNFLTVLRLDQEKPLQGVTSIKNRTNCLKTETLANGQLNAYISGASGCSNDETEQWIYDIDGKIHNRAALDQCLTTGGGNVISMATCQSNQVNQLWSMHEATGTIRQANQCFDLEGGNLKENRARLIRYGCTNGANQKWTIMEQNQSLILGLSKAENLGLITRLMTPEVSQ